MKRVALIGVAATLSCAPAARAYVPYATAPFSASTLKHTFSQAPAFMPDGRIVDSENLGANGVQVYVSNEDGSARRCLTCTLKGPNQVPQPRPQGDWVLFHSWAGHSITLGGPGYGGIGSELYVVRPDGTHITKLYGLDPAHGNGEGTDDYHAYWSPDGRRLVWAHFNGNFITDTGNGRWDVRVADFVVKDGKPALENVRVVRPDNGHWYETQWWAPDGSGFLYTESTGNMTNTELFFCRLEADGCHVRQLTRNIAWDEQAIFTPDMRDVIFMSSRDHPGFYNTFEQITLDLDLPNNLDNLAILPVFEAAFLQPVAEEYTDLYDIHLATDQVRRLTVSGDDGFIVPEFTWDPANRRLVWTEARLPPGYGVPLPLDIARQVKATAAYLQHPDLNSEGLSGGNLLSFALPLQRRTRAATFAGACAPPPRLTIALPRAGARIVRAVARIDGARVATRRGRALRRVTLANPRRESFAVRIDATRSDGRHLSVRRRFAGLGCYRMR